MRAEWGLLLVALVACSAKSPRQLPARTVPPIALGYDAYRAFADWPRLRIGQRTQMRSTYDRAGGNEDADASHFLRQDAPDCNVTLDVAGHGVLSFVRTNHWHGSPWHYVVDGNDQVVSESSTANPNAPTDGTFLPAALFPAPLALTWSTTRGADLNWVPMPFANSFTLAYERTHYGTGYYIYQLVANDDDLTQPITTWQAAPPPDDVIQFFNRAGDDLSPADSIVHSGTIQPGANAHITLKGPARLRALSFTVAAADAASFGRAQIQMTWDALSRPSVDSPVSLLFATGSLFNRANSEYLVRSLPAVIHFSGGKVIFTLYFSMPFSATATIDLIPTDALAGSIDWQIKTEPYNDPPNWFGYFHATYVDQGTPTAGQDLLLLDTTTVENGGDWCGHLAGTSFTFSDQANLGTLEGDPRFFFDDSQTPQAQGTGTEEWAGGGDYWGGQTMTLPLAGHPVGAASPAAAINTEDQIESAYRFLIADAMPFGRNARIQLEHGGTDDSTEHYRTLVYWYGRPGACLQPTDTLHVSDSADEIAHDYVSPTASTPDTLTTRYEWGIDHIGATEVYPATTDSGRHMSGTSEFSIALAPNNSGALIRRKLDYGYSDQRAEVSIADDTPGAAFVDVGTWYLAGSNRCVFSDPPGELDAAQPVAQSSNRQWRDDEFLLPRALTSGRSSVRVRIQFSGGQAWSEYRYSVYSYVLPNQ